MSFWNIKSVEQYFLSLAILRLYLCFHLIYQFTYFWAFRAGLFSVSSLYSRASIPLSGGLDVVLRHPAFVAGVLVAYLILILLMVGGIGRNLTVAAVFVVTVIIQQLNPYILNGGHNLLYFVLFYLAMADSFQHFTLFKHSPPGPSRNIFSWFGVRCIQAQVCLVYIISGMAKCHSDVWYHGTALYYILQLERFNSGFANAVIYSHPFLVTLGTYSVWIWEMYFPVFLTNWRAKCISLAFGACMHFAIGLTMMLYDFAALFIAVYIIFFPQDELRRAISVLRSVRRQIVSLGRGATKLLPN